MRRAAASASAFLAATIGCSAGALAQSQAQARAHAQAPAEAQGQGALERVVIIGASASDGYGATVSEPGPGLTACEGVDLLDAVRLSLSEKPKVLVSYATRSMFLAPHATGHAEVNHALRERPTLVVAVDFLFWYLYGTLGVEGRAFSSEEDRLISLEVGLEELERLQDATGSVLVIGDLPDLNGVQTLMLGADQVPAAETITAANTRIREWVEARQGAAEASAVALVPIGELSALARRGAPTAWGGTSWTPERDGPLVQDDRLHPTFEGIVATWARALEAARDSGVRVGTAFELDPRAQSAALRARLAEELRHVLALRAAREDAAAPAPQTFPSN